MLKFLIVLFMVLLVISLATGAFFLMMDQGDRTKKRLLHSLGVRVTLAAGLMCLIVYGVATGQLGRANPWDAGPQAGAQARQQP